MVISAFLTPRSTNHCPAWVALWLSVTLTPVMALASDSFGVQISICSQASAGSSEAGAGSSKIVIALDLASLMACSFSSQGISNCSSKILASDAFSKASSIWPLLSLAFARGTTTMLFSPWSSTLIWAMPVGPETTLTAWVLTPKSIRVCLAKSENRSSPTQLTSQLGLPAKAAAIA